MNKMIEKYYEIAGSKMKVLIPKEWCGEFFESLNIYESMEKEWEHCFQYEVVDCLDEPWGELLFRDSARWIYIYSNGQIRYEGALENGLNGAIYRIRREGNMSFIQIKKEKIYDKITHKIILNTMEIEHIIAEKQGFLLHASFVEYEEGAILFTGPSGIGKSTQADLWEKYRNARIINGDRVVVRPMGQNVFAYGIPFSGSSGIYKNETLVVRAIVCLSQKKITTIEELDKKRAFRYLWEQCSMNTWNQKDVDSNVQSLLKVMESVPIFHLSCTPDESAVILLEHTLRLQLEHKENKL